MRRAPWRNLQTVIPMPNSLHPPIQRVDLVGIKQLGSGIEANVVGASVLVTRTCPEVTFSTGRTRSENNMVTGESLKGVVEGDLRMASRK